ncbi:MAG TPA: winged helix-turn-helix domain-containing protein, partial [Ideonella sp.]|nr:winged helix-turn-helix domain-containing protein [Ideonella sp.]
MFFGACELRPTRRELLYQGAARRLPPKAFDLLLHLIRHRDRVVTKAELLAAVWSGADVSDNVLARTVMKVRQAIGDTAEESVMLRTVHRIGYRFQLPSPGASGERVVDVDAGEAARQGAARVRIAFLPVANQTGDATLDWVGWGLPLLAGQALEPDERLSVMAVQTVQHALSSLPAAGATDTEAACRSLGLAIGAHCVVQATLRRAGERLRLDYQTHGRHEMRGSVRGSETAAMGQALAAAIESALFPEAALRAVPRPGADPLATQALARALEVGSQERWDVAARLLRVVLDFNPDDKFARLHYLRTLANLHDKEALRVGEELLEIARRDADPRLLAATHEGLGRALFNMEGDDAVERAREHLDTALALARPFDDEDWVIRIYLGQAISAHVERDHARAARFYKLAWRANEVAGNQLRRAAILTNHAVVELNAGNPLVARDMAEQALSLCEQHGLHANGVDALACLALADAGLGLLRRALAHCEAAVARLAGLPPREHDSAAWVLLIAEELEFDSRSAGLAERAFRAAEHLGDGEQQRVQAALSVARAYRAARAGDLGMATRHFSQAVAQARANGYFENVHQFMRRWLTVCLRFGLHEDVPPLLDQILALPRFGEDPDLQAAVLQARAALLHARDDTEGALRALREAMRLAPPGWVAGCARLDAAWLLLEAG